MVRSVMFFIVLQSLSLGLGALGPELRSGGQLSEHEESPAPIHLLLRCPGDKYTYRVSIYIRNVLFCFPAVMNVSFINPAPGLLSRKQYFSEAEDPLCSTLEEP